MRTFTLLALVVCGLFCATTVFAQDDAAADLAKALKAADHQACIEACQHLSRLGPTASGSVEDLIKALKMTDHTDVQRCAALALSAIGPKAKDAIPALIATLQSKNPKLRAYAAHALGEIGPAAATAALPLIDAITDKDPIVRREARDALKSVKAPPEVVLPSIGKLLNAASPTDAAAAVMTLAELGEVAVPDLCKALDNKDTCYWAALTLAEIGPQAAGAVPQLGALLDHKAPEIRMQAALALGAIGASAKPMAKKINKLLGSDPVEGVRYAAAFALGRIGDPSISHEKLAESLDSDDPFLKVTGAWALLKLSRGETPLLRKAIKNIVVGLSANNENVRLAAARALADIDLPDAVVGPALTKAMAKLEADGPEKLLPIVNAFAALGGKAVRGCIRSLENKRPFRFYALQVLQRVGSDAVPAVPALMATLDDSDATLRRETLFALGAIGPGAAPAVEKIAEKLADSDPDVAHAACYALSQIGPAAQAALPALEKQMGSDDEFMRITAVWAALKINPNDARLQEKAVPYLVKALTNERVHVRVEAAYTLGEIGGPAKAAIPALEKSLEDTSPTVRAAARAALERLK